jgi:hypothetical protein
MLATVVDSMDVQRLVAGYRRMRRRFAPGRRVWVDQRGVLWLDPPRGRPSDQLFLTDSLMLGEEAQQILDRLAADVVLEASYKSQARPNGAEVAP